MWIRNAGGNKIAVGNTELGRLAHGLGTILDLIIAVFLWVIIDFAIGWYGKGGYSALAYFLFKDVILGGRSLGKRMAGCYVLCRYDNRQCPLWMHPIRILVTLVMFPVEIFPRIGRFAMGLIARDYHVAFTAFNFEWGSKAIGLSYFARAELQ